jgi:hypothetical protein
MADDDINLAALWVAPPRAKKWTLASSPGCLYR